MNDYAKVLVAIVAAFAVIVVVAVVMARPQQAGGSTDVLHVYTVEVNGRPVPCVVAVNPFHPTNGGSVDCDWSGKP